MGDTVKALTEFLVVCREFLARPKTKFDIRDRGRALLYFLAAVLLLQAAAEIFWE